MSRKRFCLVTGDKKTSYVGNLDLSDTYIQSFGHYQSFNNFSVKRAFYALLNLGLINLGETKPEEYFQSIVLPYLIEQKSDMKLSDTDKVRIVKVRKFVENVIEVNLENEEEREKLVSFLVNNISEFQLNVYANQLIRETIYSKFDLTIYEDSQDYIDDILLVQPYEHQKRAINRWLNTRNKMNKANVNMALFLEPRLGKTLITLYCLNHWLSEQTEFCATIIVAPIRTLSTVWKRQLQQFVNEKYREKLFPIVLTEIPIKQRVQFMLGAKELAKSIKKHVIIITNYETFSRLNPEATKSLKNTNLFDFVILDEAHKIKDHSTKQAQNIFNLLDGAKTKFILTGTPYGNSYTDTYQILKFIEDAPFGCYSLSQFIHVYGYTYNGKFYLSNRREFFDHLSKVAEIVRQQDVNFLMPELSVEFLQMFSEHYAKYTSIVNSAKAELINGATIKIPNILSLIAKLRQASSGFLYYSLEDEDVRHSQMLVEPDEIAKFAYTMELIDENIGNTPIVLCLTFEKEYEIFRDLLEQLNKSRYPKIKWDIIRGGMSASQQTEIIERFQDGKIDLLVVNPKAASLGLDLSIANLMIYPSYGWSLIEERQMRDRCVSPYKKIPTKVIYVAHTDSIDVRIMEALENKRENLEEVMKRGTSKVIDWLAGLEKQQQEAKK
ncbi:MAG: DEAD/DEAH box helicase [Candidatus Calescibacterium sp.]|nr:DEAD/DEAH box helicase [Candidatus Calescibacterium sp.]